MITPFLFIKFGKNNLIYYLCKKQIMAKINYINKSQTSPYDANKFNAQDANEIKESVNALYDIVENYKIYTALLNFDGTNFTISLLNNTIGNIVWSNPTNGQIRGTLTNSFIDNKTMGFCTPSTPGYIVSFQRQSNDFIRFTFTLHDGTTTSTPNLVNCPIEIRVYN